MYLHGKGKIYNLMNGFLHKYLDKYLDSSGYQFVDQGILYLFDSSMYFSS
jgi:hypothetical protein